MIDIATLKAWLGDSLKAAGLRGRGAVWRMEGVDVQYVVHIDRPPYGKRLAVEIGLDLQSAVQRPRATDCQIVLYLEFLPFARRSEVAEALDLDSNLAPEQRRRELDDAVAGLGRYLADHVTLAAVRAAYRAGDFRAGFVHKDARKVLEAESAAE